MLDEEKKQVRVSPYRWFRLIEIADDRLIQ